jgi:hypothetical protein
VTVGLAREDVQRSSELAWVEALVDLAGLERRGWDRETQRFVPSAEDPLFGYTQCPVRGCGHVTERASTMLCSRCQRHTLSPRARRGNSGA